MAKPRSRAEQYARLFRKAGVFAGKGDYAAAIRVLEEGLRLARGHGDDAMVRVFSQQITTHKNETGSGPP